VSTVIFVRLRVLNVMDSDIDLRHSTNTHPHTRIIAHVNGCVALGANRAPNFILLDFVNIGQAFQGADLLNGLAYYSRTPLPSETFS
jgi:hypothetical protein